MLPGHRLIAVQLPSRDPARPQPLIQIRTQDGRLRTELRDRFVMPGPRGWTECVRLMGYQPISRWRPVPVDSGPQVPPGAQHLCKVEPTPVVATDGRHAVARLAAGLLPTCSAATTLSRAHADRLGDWPWSARAGDVIVCELGAGHRMPHTGLGQPRPHDDVDERSMPWWWLLWTRADEPGLLSEALLCGVPGRVPGAAHDPDPCALPRGHDDAGNPPHTWQLTAFSPFRPGVTRATAPATPRRR
ncbi:hypothetical protein [Jiangella muralis]|uniref:hypothetical protein n=1 Tax=Jiangella muralis TaxID=702383 RepID=UPI0006A001C8|nr:hypothetical protein [Jiangella muralis]